MSQTILPDSLLQAMTWRCIGPSRGGRVVAVAGDPHSPAVYYFGAVAGGVWKTDDAGMTWRNVSDKFFKSASVGALAVSDSDPNVIYAGMGESTIRTDVSYGDGVYKSTDHGQSWTHLGLTDTRHIGKVRVHPKNPDLVYVAALGHAFGTNEERGVFRSKDGGASWEKVLYKSDKAGAVDLTLDPHNPHILYASIWQVYRNFWELSSGGPESGLWKSSDGGDTWVELTDKPGFPKGLKGKIGISASPVKAGRIWALVESTEEPGFYRSDDFGESWVLQSDLPDLRQRPWYYMHVFADPQEADTVYVLNLDMWKSTDGGKNFTKIATPHGDNHDLWIDPRNNRRMIEGNDGGGCISFNGGESFSTIYNQLTGQFYHAATDNRFPYRVYATQQDNSSISVPSDTISGAIAWTDCFVAGTGESGYIAIDPQDDNVVYVGAVGSSPGGMGALQRYDHASGQIQLVNVWPEAFGAIGPKELKYRFPWTYPILFSPHDPNTLYTCANVAFRSTDKGHSWQPFSPDLTRNDPDKLGPSGGPITLDTSGAEHYCTIYSFRESPHEAGLFWAGSDDGLLHLSRDNGQSWQNVTPPDLPEWSWIRAVEPSPHDPATLYLAATRYKLDDNTPYLYKTTDYGQSWQKITQGIPADDYTRMIRSDPKVPGLLYAGSETGLYVSWDDGFSWQRWQANLPIAPVYDILIKEDDLILATHGRSFWLLDDLTPLRQWAMQQEAGSKIRLFAPRTTHRILPDIFGMYTEAEGKGYTMGLSTAATFIASKNEFGQPERKFLDSGEGAPRSALVYYYLPQAPAEGTTVILAFLDSQGNPVRQFTTKSADYDKWDEKKKSLDSGPWISTRAGVNRFVWNLRHEGSLRVAGNKTAGEALVGPFAIPGDYQVRLSVGDQSYTQAFSIVNDPRVQVSQPDLEAQIALLLQVRDKISDAHRAVNRLRDVREQVEGWRKRMADKEALIAAADELLKKLAAVEDALIVPGDQKNTYSLVTRPRLNAALASVISVIASADAKPTQGSAELAAEYMGKIDEQIATLDKIFAEELAALNQAIQAAQIPPVFVPAI